MKMNLETLTALLQDEFGDGDLGDLIEMARDESAGVCLSCGAVQYGCEPDARRYACEVCNEATVYGIEEIALHLLT